MLDHAINAPHIRLYRASYGVSNVNNWEFIVKNSYLIRGSGWYHMIATDKADPRLPGLSSRCQAHVKFPRLIHPTTEIYVGSLL